jgi:hypothetical protein
MLQKEKIIYSLSNQLEKLANISNIDKYPTKYEQYLACIHLMNESTDKNERTNKMINEYDVKDCQNKINHYWHNILNSYEYLPNHMKSFYKLKIINYLEQNKHNPYLYKLDSENKSNMERISQ